MKRKVVVAMLATMALTMGSVGTTFAMTNAQGTNVEVSNDDSEHDGMIWVVDKEAVYENVLVSPEEGHYETIHHEEEGHYEKVLVSPEEGHYETVHHEEEGHWENVLVSPEEGHWVHHEAEYKTVHHEAEYETVHHEEEGHYETQQVQVGTEPIYEQHKVLHCNTCGQDFWCLQCDGGDGNAAVFNHILTHDESIAYVSKFVEHKVGEKPVYEEKKVWILDKEAWDEQVLVKEAWDEQILVKEAWDEWVLDKEAVYEDKWIVDKEAWDEEIWVVDKEAVYEDKWIVDKEAWDEEVWVVDKEAVYEEVLVSPEEGHWEPIKDDTTPENPDSDVDNDTEKPDTVTPDEDKNDSQAENVDSKPVKDKGSQNKTDVPETGDPTNLGYLAAMVGSALTGGSALVWKLKRRK